MTTRYTSLAEVIGSPVFPDVDLALRRGRHIDRDDGDWYQFLTDAQDHLERFYRRYDCELVVQSDGYFFLLPTGKQFSMRRLSEGEMIVGQALALQYLDPSTLQSGGTVTHEQLLTRLANLIDDTELANALNPKKRHTNERVVQETIRTKIASAIQRLSKMGFVDKIEHDRLRLRAPLLRFAAPVRGLADPNAALERLIARGEMARPDAEADEDDEVDDEDDDEVES
ncbi:MAG: condensin subunit E [Deltaproteobacteria bacterium]|nr:condensin subunit E [Deltaproteobacteria bacterium]